MEGGTHVQVDEHGAELLTDPTLTLFKYLFKPWLNQELQYLAQGTYSAEWVLVLVQGCCSGIGQWGKAVTFVTSLIIVWVYGMMATLMSCFKRLSTVTAYFATPTTHPVIQKNICNRIWENQASTHKIQNRVFWLKVFGMTSRIGWRSLASIAIRFPEI